MWYMKKIVGISSSIVVCIVIIVYVFFLRAEDTKELYMPTVTVAPVVDAQNVQEHVFGATVKSADEAIVTAQVAGTVKNMSVHEGEHVVRGHMIGSIDAGEYAAQYTQAQKTVQIAEEQEKLARRKWDDYKPEEREQIKLDVDRARAQLAESSAYVQKSQIFAPFDGVISSKFVSEGSGVTPGSALFRIVGDGAKKEIIFDVSSEISIMIALDDTVRVTRGDVHTFATVYAIDPVADTQTRKVTVHAWLDDADSFELGAFVDVTVALATERDGSSVPVESLVRFYDDYSVFQVVDDYVLMTPVHVMQMDKDIATVQGIAPGANVVVSGAHLINDGEHVVVVSNDK